MKDIIEKIDNILLNEKTLDLDKDVDFIYDKCFKKHMKNLNNLYVGKEFGKVNSSQLKSEPAVEAHKIKPIEIRCGVFEHGSLYHNRENFIQVSINAYAVRSLESFSYNFDVVLSLLPSNEVRKTFKAEFTEAKIKGSIYHELAHWIDDVLHGQHLSKRSRKAYSELISGRKKEAYKILNQRRKYVTLAPYEIEGQIHSIKQMKRSYKDKWDELSFFEMVELNGSLASIISTFNRANDKKAVKDWVKAILKRMSREKLLGKNMKKVDYAKLTKLSV
jgi:hypothetical protein